MNTLHFSCTSLELAKQFGKNHAAVMRAVCRLLQNLPKSYAALHFKKLPSAYAISHEGVLLLFSSFTGKKSLALPECQNNAQNA